MKCDLTCLDCVMLFQRFVLRRNEYCSLGTNRTHAHVAVNLRQGLI